MGSGFRTELSKQKMFRQSLPITLVQRDGRRHGGKWARSIDRSLEKRVVMTQEQWSHYSVPPTENTCQGTGRGHYLGVLVDLGEVLLIAVDVQSDGGARTPSAAQSKDDARTICENDPQALEKRTEIFSSHAGGILKPG